MDTRYSEDGLTKLQVMNDYDSSALGTSKCLGLKTEANSNEIRMDSRASCREEL